MTGLTLKIIADVVEGTLFCDKDKENSTIEGVTIDSRLVEKDFLFVCIKGERVDGHDFINDVAEKGAICAFSEKKIDNCSIPYILVESSTEALRMLATYYRSILNIKLVGISGSVGKTSTKEFIAAVLGEKYKVLKTAGNYNNEIGLPLTILKIRDEHQIAVLEMGISDFNEMNVLSKIAKPDVCVLTNIGPCHLEALGDLDGVLKAKSEMFNHSAKGAFIVLNGDDEKLQSINEVNGIKPIFYGKGENNNIVAGNIVNNGITGCEFTLIDDDKELRLSTPIPGEHMVLNALAAYAVGKHFGLTDNDIKTGLMNMQTVGGRVNVIKTEAYTIIDDCYNANPVSMKASIDVLVHANGRKVAILGDMFELGVNEVKMHEDVGVYFAKKDIDVLINVGNLSKNIYAGAKSNGYKGQMYSYDTVDEFINDHKNVLKEKDTILLKASHSMNFSKILEELSK